MARLAKQQVGKAAGPILFGLVALAVLWAAFEASQVYFLRETAARGAAALSLHVENLKGRLGRYRALPRIYAKSLEIRALLRQPRDPGLLAAANRFLVDANLSTGAADSYLLDTRGTAIAASNWDDEPSFVDENYSYRPYYREAMQGRLGRFFALGTASGKRGYYFAHPVRDGREIVGVVVVKVGVADIEAEMRASVHEVLISDADGIIVLAGHPDRRLRALRPLSAETRRRIAEERRFEAETLDPVEWRDIEVSVIGVPRVEAVPDRSDRRRQTYLLLSQAMPVEGWNAHLLIETRGVLRQSLIVVGFAFFGLMALGLAFAVLRERRRRFEERLAANKQAHDLLERAVAERTEDLSVANRQLEEEVHERKTAEEELRQAQQEVIQAGKLAALGQMSAALSHEFNQPLTAIRTYAENAGAFMERGREEEAQKNLGLISQLTERMAALSKHLSSFARKPQDRIRPVSLTGALTETLALLQGRFEKFGVTPSLELPDDEVWVIGGHVRLQQVIMNLLTNAIDAMRETRDPCLRIAVRRDAGRTELVVEDNGSGIDPELAAQIFDPFFTTKGVGEGLGLGLSISYNIVKDFGGTIEVGAGETGAGETGAGETGGRKGGGTRFVVGLKTATAAEAMAAQ